MKVNYYEILGVERSASDREIRERFRQLARENHPDRYRGQDKAEAERKFQTLTEAANVLTNPARRRQHDEQLASGGAKGAADFAQVAKVYMAKGVKAFKDGDIRSAYENFDMAVKHTPQDAKAQHYFALTADRIADEAEFFSFGTNDLTQTTLGISRDDAGKFLPIYIQQGITPADPFQTLDRRGVGRLVRMGTELGRSARPGLKVGICGEHGGDPDSISFFHRAGLDYVSCSPFRVPVARLAAAQSALREKGIEDRTAASV